MYTLQRLRKIKPLSSGLNIRHFSAIDGLNANGEPKFLDQVKMFLNRAAK